MQLSYWESYPRALVEIHIVNKTVANIHDLYIFFNSLCILFVFICIHDTFSRKTDTFGMVKVKKDYLFVKYNGLNNKIYII